MFDNLPILSLLIFLPLAGAVLVSLTPRQHPGLMRGFTLGVTLLVFVISLPLFFNFDSSRIAFQFEERREWIPAMRATYHLGVDGISLLMVLLTTFLTPLVILSSWNDIKTSIKGYLVSMLLLEAGMIGVFVALDLLLFYVFWEVMLIPMYFIIGVWGGPRRIYAAVKFFIYTMVGSLLMLVAILFIYFYYGKVTGTLTFDFVQIRELLFPENYQFWLFLAFGLSFAIKVPMFPFHTWLPDAHVEAPTAGSVILAGVLLKMGTYGFLRFCLPLFPNASLQFAPLLSVLAIIGIIYGAWVAMVQPDIKKLVAYSSVSHLGFVMLGIFTFTHQGLQGALIQMVNHGLSTGALFLIVGMLYERRHTREIADFGGLARPLPVFTTFFMIATLASIGLPGLNGFVGEFLVLLGTFLTNKTYAAFAATGVIFAAVYMLWMFQRVMFGRLDKEENRRLRDLTRREIAVLVPVTAMMVLIGVWAQPFLGKMETSVDALIRTVHARAAKVNDAPGLAPLDLGWRIASPPAVAGE
ncbi:MAG: NADH-quinone oxidoreductase subunit M [candidate division KSB1 bacterium]|nr:NADH-quinone oxidoreductase subunit M [candidate division KSB1 bacterium]MDZ7276427.1 NADH-quinone oxidoreductase subunit M [candidate division KSB1 bacterium]MDZ7288097.1 NADH-quinone oxidoreductase subunit M [candidate division KSB1 bacterium]MDZ7300198.1 NADH-quinone oxidoreductase subunit M [candidate division KSB1 bacterium]MDZ7305769.1 NADH-quinone oxidoreductase subunit M [candidate division KSB1 bacterium]